MSELLDATNTAKTAPRDLAEPVETTIARDVETRRARRNVLVALLMAAVILATMNAAALERYIGGLGDHWIVEEALLLAQRWSALMDESGFSAPRDAVRGVMDWLQGLGWGEGGEAKPWDTGDEG